MHKVPNVSHYYLLAVERVALRKDVLDHCISPVSERTDVRDDGYYQRTEAFRLALRLRHTRQALHHFAYEPHFKVFGIAKKKTNRQTRARVGAGETCCSLLLLGLVSSDDMDAEINYNESLQALERSAI